MKNIVFYIILISFLVSCSCDSDKNLPKEVTIAGRIINYNQASGKNILNIFINDNGRADQLCYPTKIDSSGNFNVKFTRSYTQDVMIAYKPNFRAIVTPGDSLYVEFDGSTNQIIKIFETIEYSGDNAKMNKQLSVYLKNYFETRPSSKQRKEFKKLGLYEYKALQDSIRISRREYANSFISEYHPPRELRKWIWTNIEFSYYDDVIGFPDYRKYKDYPENWHTNYYSFLDSISLITTETLIYSDIRWFINQYFTGYIYSSIFNFGDSLKTVNLDSLILKKIIELVPDEGLLEQLTLTEYINSTLRKYKVSLYEDNGSVINERITERYLIDPLKRHYEEINNFLNEPIEESELNTNILSDIKSPEIWSRIIEEGKGKVLYIDCWGTWCGACINEIPHAIKMHEHYIKKGNYSGLKTRQLLTI